MVKRLLIDAALGVVVLPALKLLYRLAFGLGSNAVMGWGDDQIATYFNIKAPTLGVIIDVVVGWGPPVLVTAGLISLFDWYWRRRHGRAHKPPVETPANLADEAESMARRINALGAKYPQIMPDHPNYPATGRQHNDAINALFMKEYQEIAATDVQRILADAARRKLLDHGDRVYERHTVVARAGVEEISRVLARVIVNERAGGRLPLPPGEFEEQRGGDAIVLGDVSGGSGAKGPGGHAYITAKRDLIVGPGSTVKGGDGGPGGDANLTAGGARSAVPKWINMRDAFVSICELIGLDDISDPKADRRVRLWLEIRQKARDGEIIIRGRPMPAGSFKDDSPAENIEKEHWRDFDFEPTRYMPDAPVNDVRFGQTIRQNTHGNYMNFDRYYDLHADANAITQMEWNA